MSLRQQTTYKAEAALNTTAAGRASLLLAIKLSILLLKLSTFCCISPEALNARRSYAYSRVRARGHAVGRQPLAHVADRCMCRSMRLASHGYDAQYGLSGHALPTERGSCRRPPSPRRASRLGLVHAFRRSAREPAALPPGPEARSAARARARGTRHWLRRGSAQAQRGRGGLAPGRVHRGGAGPSSAC